MLADRFELRHVLGTGGMATVWSAHDRRMGRTVAVKELRERLARLEELGLEPRRAQEESLEPRRAQEEGP